MHSQLPSISAHRLRKTNIYRLFEGKSQGKRSCPRHWREWRDNIKNWRKIDRLRRRRITVRLPWLCLSVNCDVTTVVRMVTIPPLIWNFARDVTTLVSIIRVHNNDACRRLPEAKQLMWLCQSVTWVSRVTTQYALCDVTFAESVHIMSVRPNKNHFVRSPH
jgi:hypothetical protein